MPRFASLTMFPVLGSLALMPGCIIVSSHEAPPVPPAPIVLDAYPEAPTGVLQTELRAIRENLLSSSDRAEAFERIASRPALTSGDQLALIHATCEGVLSSSDRADIFFRLAANPCLTEIGYRALLEEGSDCILSSSDRRKLLEKLQHRASAGWIHPHEHRDTPQPAPTH